MGFSAHARIGFSADPGIGVSEDDEIALLADTGIGRAAAIKIGGFANRQNSTWLIYCSCVNMTSHSRPGRFVPEKG